MHRIASGEHLMTASTGALSAGTMKEADADQLLKDLRAGAMIGKRAQKATPQLLAGAGITVIREPANE